MSSVFTTQACWLVAAAAYGQLIVLENKGKIASLLSLSLFLSFFQSHTQTLI